MEVDFKPLQLSDIPKLKPYLGTNPTRLCDWTVGGIWMWRDYFEMEYAILENHLVFKVKYLRQLPSFCFMYSDQTVNLVSSLKEYTKSKDMPLILCLVDAKTKEQLVQSENCLHINEETNWFDYLYNIEDLIKYSGKHYATQRNHVNAFRKTYPADSVKVVTPTNAECLAYLDDFYADKTITDPIEEEEKNKCYEVFQQMDAYQFDTIGVTINDKLVAIASGEVCGDTVYEHIEKASSEIEGIYTVISQQFQIMIHEKYPDVKYTNKEEDVGDPGLRYSKSKYRPIALLEKNTIEICKG